MSIVNICITLFIAAKIKPAGAGWMKLNCWSWCFRQRRSPLNQGSAARGYKQQRQGDQYKNQRTQVFGQVCPSFPAALMISEADSFLFNSLPYLILYSW